MSEHDYGTDREVRKPLDWLTPFGRAIVADVREHGPSTAEEIARRIAVFDGKFVTPQAVRSSCAYVRGSRWLDDGSVAISVTMQSALGTFPGFTHTDPPSPIRWRYITDEEAVQRWGVTVTDCAGMTCRYTPVEDLKPGDVVIIGWRSKVKAVSVSYGRGEARVFWRGVPGPDQWNPLGTELPVEVCDG